MCFILLKIEFRLSRNEVAIGFVNAILCPDGSGPVKGLPLLDLQQRVENQINLLQPGKHISFEDFAGHQIQNFVDRNTDWYVTFKDKGKIMVRLLPKKIKEKMPLKVQGKPPLVSDQLSVSANEASDVDLGVTDYETASSDFENIQQVLNVSEFSSLASNERCSVNEPDEIPWTEKIRTKHHKKLLKRTSSDGDSIPTFFQNSSSQKIILKEKKKQFTRSSEKYFAQLLERGESKTVLIRNIHGCIKKSSDFALDMVSLWNTPREESGFIIIQDDHLESEIDDDDISKLKNALEKQSSSFSYFPCCEYEVVTFQKRMFITIEIAHLHDNRMPILKSDQCASDDFQQLWCRSGTKRKLVKMNDPEIFAIYSWFQQREVELRKKQSVQQKSDTDYQEPRISNSVCWNGELSFDNSIKNFLEKVQRFKKGHFSLMTGDIRCKSKNLSAFSKLPLISVYDFDIKGRECGLLNANEPTMFENRSLQIYTWKDNLPGLSEESTLWTFLLGRRDQPDSRMSDDNDIRLWLKQVSAKLQIHAEQIQRFVNGYTVLTVLILWPENEDLVGFMQKFIQICLDENLEPSPKLILCMSNEPKTETGRSYLNTLWREWNQHVYIFKLSMEDICSAIDSVLNSDQGIPKNGYIIPAYDGKCSLSAREASWLREDMEVLYQDNPYNKASEDVDALSEERHQFYRGGSFHWFAWYECGNDRVDVDRDLKKSIVSKLDAIIESNKSEIVYLYHAPGSGGTTLAQRVLWDFHQKIPCVHIKLRTASPVMELVVKVEMLHDKSHKPVLLMIDGEEESRVRHLMRLLTSNAIAIILYVKQYPYQIKKGETMRTKVFLESTVSSKEAKNLAMKYGDRCFGDQYKINTLNKLSRDVEKKEPHFLYEFGLAAFTHDFKGVEAYVKGYLRLQDNTDGKLKHWQKILGYLSLVYYYGQASLPCQFFQPLLCMKEDEVVDIDDFGYPIKDFVVVDKNEARKGNVRICHHIIAQEILQQILGDPREKFERGPDLSKSARQSLESFCIDFIDYASSRKQQTCGTIAHVLARTFIFRDNREISETAEQGRRKPRLARIIIDISSKQPLFTERLHVLKKLTDAFPEDPNFIAHLGRFYAYCRPDDQKIAEQCLQKALDLANEQTKGKKIEELDERWKLSLMHIYHMYGTIIQKQIAMYTGQAIDDIPPRKTKGVNVKTRLEYLIPLAERSCSYFTLCRECTPPGRENCYGYVGEINVRLQICDFVEKHFEMNDSRGIKGFLRTRSDDWQGTDFVKKSISIIDTLLMECYNVIDQDDMDPSIQSSVFWYNFLFHKNTVNLDTLSSSQDPTTFRLRIAMKKLKCVGKSKDYTVLEHIQSTNDINDIVSWYEEIFRKNGPLENKRALDRDYQEWLFAIRHAKCSKHYELENVLLVVKQWEDQLKTPMSKFYNFIFTSLMGFGSKKFSGKTECLLEAQRILKNDMKKAGKFLLKPKYPREWLGKDETGVRRLVSGTRFLSLNLSDRDVVKSLMMSDLAVCKGTICQPNNKKGAGFISLDLGDNLVQVTVFYIPNVCNLVGSHYGGQRVEFVIGFTVENGYEAFNVKLLEKYGCGSCCGSVEITQHETFATCGICGNKVVKEDMNRISSD